MQLSEDEKQKRLQALKDLLSEEDEKTASKEKEDDENEEDSEKEPEEESEDEPKKESKEACEKDSEKKEMKEESYQEHLSAMFDGTDLSEESKEKLKILFEAAVGYEVDKKVSVIKENLEKELQSAIKAKEEEMKEEADAYLSYVVEEWTSKHEVALKQQVKLDIMESFIGGLRGLFLEHNFNIPEEQTSMVDELMEKVESLETDIKALARKNVEVSEELDSARRELTFKEITEGMTALDVEKLRGLVESKRFETAEEFKKGVALIKESYFKNDEVVSEEKETVIPEQKEEIPASIQEYASMISKIVRK